MIRTENLTKRYRRNDALHNVTFEVPPASVFALTGPNGAGKSTLLKILLNLTQPTGGRVSILDADSRRITPAHLAQVAYISENQHLPVWMTVAALLDFTKAFYPTWDDALAAELVRNYELPLGRKLSQLSRGMKVKAALAASLAYRPRIILLDEPFTGLDILVREQLIETIIDRTPEATVLIASHDLAEIETVATHIAYLNEGRLEFAEETASLHDRFREVEITLDEPAAVQPPATWLQYEQSDSLARFTDTRFNPTEIAARFPNARDITARPLGFRAIFLALAKSRRTQCA